MISLQLSMNILRIASKLNKEFFSENCNDIVLTFNGYFILQKEIK